MALFYRKGCYLDRTLSADWRTHCPDCHIGLIVRTGGSERRTGGFQSPEYSSIVHWPNFLGAPFRPRLPEMRMTNTCVLPAGELYPRHLLRTVSVTTMLKTCPKDLSDCSPTGSNAQEVFHRGIPRLLSCSASLRDTLQFPLPLSRPQLQRIRPRNHPTAL